MEVIETGIKGLNLIKPQVFKDDRGFFTEFYHEKKFAGLGMTAVFKQDNHSFSAKEGVVRGLHFQNQPHAQAKLVRVIRGAVYDVAVDLREDSETFGEWRGYELSADNFMMLYIPRGFAHGFCTLESNTEFMYKNDNFYDPGSEDGIMWNDPDLNIDWPVQEAVVSEKDSKQQSFKDYKKKYIQ